MSQFEVKVVPIKLEKHPNADSLSLVRVFDAYVCCVRTDDWKDKALGVFVPPDSIVPDTEDYAFLAGHRRIKAHKFRGIMSQGLLVSAPEGSKEGDDVAERLGIEHYEPELHVLKTMPGNMESPPPITGCGSKYDIESWFKYRSIFDSYPNIQVSITEKIHGANARYTFQQGRMWAASRAFYRKFNLSDSFWRVTEKNPWIEAYCRLSENAVIYGELYGAVQKFTYGATSDNPLSFRMFDMWENGKFQDWSRELIESGLVNDNPNPNSRIVPILYTGAYSHDVVERLMDGPSTIPGAKNIREGIVIKPLKEIWNDEIGRLILKAVSPVYLEKS